MRDHAQMGAITRSQPPAALTTPDSSCSVPARARPGGTSPALVADTDPWSV